MSTRQPLATVARVLPLSSSASHSGMGVSKSPVSRLWQSTVAPQTRPREARRRRTRAQPNPWGFNPRARVGRDPDSNIYLKYRGKHGPLGEPKPMGRKRPANYHGIPCKYLIIKEREHPRGGLVAIGPRN